MKTDLIKEKNNNTLCFYNDTTADAISNSYDHQDIVCAIRSIFGFLKGSLNKEIKKHSFLSLTNDKNNPERKNAVDFISESIKKHAGTIISKKIYVPENFYVTYSSDNTPADSMITASALFEILPQEITSSSMELINSNKTTVLTPDGNKELNKTIAVSSVSCAIIASCLSDNYFEHALSHMLMDHKIRTPDESMKNEIMRLSARSMIKELSNCDIVDGRCENLNFIFDSMISSLAYNPYKGCVNIMNVFDDLQSFITKEQSLFYVNSFIQMSSEKSVSTNQYNELSYQ